jgi:acyl carrier protein
MNSDIICIPSIEEQVREHITDSFLSEDGVRDFRDDDDLLTILDSLQLLRMVMHLEATFQIKIHDEEITAENLGTVQRIGGFIRRKQPVS